jgi:Flp pilus assembly pilin Flp
MKEQTQNERKVQMKTQMKAQTNRSVRLSKRVEQLKNRWNEMQLYAANYMASMLFRLMRKLRETAGQGTTEYAILVGVLVVIAIVAVVAFKDKLQSLWESISSGINGL